MTNCPIKGIKQILTADDETVFGKHPDAQTSNTRADSNTYLYLKIKPSLYKFDYGKKKNRKQVAASN